MMEKEITKMCEKASERLDKAIIRTFKRMGHEFEDEEELERFVAKNCRIEDSNGFKTVFLNKEKVFEFDTNPKTELKKDGVNVYFKFKAYK